MSNPEIDNYVPDKDAKLLADLVRLLRKTGDVSIGLHDKCEGMPAIFVSSGHHWIKLPLDPVLANVMGDAELFKFTLRGCIAGLLLKNGEPT